ncbi:MINDY deubiquitinase, partial [Teratosphaeria destructans]
MVTRKPVPAPRVNTADPAAKSSAAAHDPPYPTTPTHTELDRAKTIHSIHSVYSPDLHTSPAFDLIDMNQARSKPRRDSDVSSHGTWDDSDDEREGAEQRHTPENAAELPKPLQIRPRSSSPQQQQQKHDELPAALRPGPANGVPAQPRTSVEEEERKSGQEEAHANPWAAPLMPQKTAEASNNPYRQQQNGYAPESSSQAAWREQQQQQHAPIQPHHAPPAVPVELPTSHTPADEVSAMSLGEHRPSDVAPYETAEILAVPQQTRPKLVSVNGPSVQNGEDLLGTDDAWQTQAEHADGTTAATVPPPNAPSEHEYAPPAGPPPGWTPAQPEFAPPPGPPPKAAPVTNLIDHPEPTVQSSERQPQVPPISTAQPSASRPTEPVPETPGARDKRQRSENYQIKHVSWSDASFAPDEMRHSPILTQNANGPCPLLALVNALVLSTPRNVDSALIDTLRTRETVSLGLLLDAVFEELMSGRRGNNAENLPDVGELYAFLLALHTGMNVNPRFITPVQAPRASLDTPPPEKAPLHPVERAQTKAGCFEETKEMRLYSTFNIPLIHGWTAPKNTPAYLAFERTAQSFDDWLIKQFEEQDLETKLRAEGLNEDEQQTLQDIQTIKSFLATWPTQLSDYGLETISASLKPGQIAILFRNDHFSTLYKEPKHGALMTLVTDQGYSGHDEIVWESLVDVNGSASEMFSGDFRVVSHQEDVGRLNAGNSGGGEEGWETVQNSRNRYRNHDQRSQDQSGPARLANGVAQNGHETPPPLPARRQAPSLDGDTDNAAQNGSEINAQPHEMHHRTTSEQEDHDLALALQLQEEEEDRERQAAERRRREQELSERFLSTESTEGPRPAIPPRRSGNNPAPRPRQRP